MASFELGELPAITPASPSLQTPPRLKRPPSYSDSYYVLGGPLRLESATNLLSPPADQQTVASLEATPIGPRIQLFCIKSAIHLLFISMFETIFFFYYVSVTENNGILATINTYYKPFINTCPAWPPLVKEALYQTLTYNGTYEEILAKGTAGFSAVAAGNRRLFEQSLAASGVCFAIVLVGSCWLRFKEIPVRWWVVFGENISMVVLLGLYEYFFFRVIIYNYGTLSTPELNEYLVKGVYDCVS